MNRIWIALFALLLLPGIALSSARADDLGADDLGADDLGDSANAVMKKQAPAIVTIRMVIDIEFGGQNRETRLQARGVAISDSGLIMTALTTIKPNVNVRGPRGKNLEAKITPADIKIVFEKDEKEHDAFVVVKDTKRGLAFLQIRDFNPETRTIKWIDFASSAKPVIGDQVVTVTRLSKGFDYAPLFTVARVIGKVKKPRKGHLIDKGGNVGLPVFNLDGKLLGIHARMKSGLREGLQRNSPGQPVLLSAKEVNGVIKQAMKKAAEGEPE